MKRYPALFFILALIIALAACGSESVTEEKVRQKFPEYYDLNTAKGLEVYVWQTAENTYYCGILPGTNRTKMREELCDLAAHGATVEEMKVILSSYHLPKESIFIAPCILPNSDFEYEIDNAYIQKVNALFADLE